MNVEGKVVLITGAAGALGHVVAHRFGDAGARLVLVDNRPDRLAELCNDLKENYGALLIGNTDVTNPRSVGKMVEMVIRERERIDILLNLVGGYRAGPPIHETPPEVWDFLMNLNAKSVFLVAGAVIPHMIEQGGGKIISISAKPALQGTKGHGVYSAAKAAVIRLTEAMSAELKDHNINVNCVLPSIIDTPANRQEMPKADYSKWVSPEALADVLLFLASDASRTIHGAAIPVYGRAG